MPQGDKSKYTDTVGLSGHRRPIGGSKKAAATRKRNAAHAVQLEPGRA